MAGAGASQALVLDQTLSPHPSSPTKGKPSHPTHGHHLRCAPLLTALAHRPAHPSPSGPPPCPLLCPPALPRALFSHAPSAHFTATHPCPTVLRHPAMHPRTTCLL